MTRQSSGARAARARPAEEDPVRNVTLAGYSVALLVNLGLWSLSWIVDSDDLPVIYALLFVPTGLAITYGVYKAAAALVTPLTLFAVVWLVAVPATSFSAPLMREMSSREIGLVCIFGMAFTFGGLVANAPMRRHLHEQPVIERESTLGRMRSFARALLLISILALLLNTALEGRIALFDTASDDRKATAQFYGFPLLASLGTISLAIFAKARGLTKRDVFPAVVYVVLQLLTGQRFVAVLALLLVIFTLASARQLTVRDVRRVAVASASVVAAFSFVSIFRGGTSDHQRYFISTGIYGGDPRWLQWTEIVRYFGMSQRNMSTVLDREAPAALDYTLSPLMGILGNPPESLGTTTFGYTANNIIAYLYSDFGDLWPAVVIGFSLLVNFSFNRCRAVPTFTNTFTWSVCALGLTTSFFAYLNAYMYWVVLFPIIITLAERRIRGVGTSTRTAAALRR